MIDEEWLDFEDVLIQPSFSMIDSRANVVVDRKFKFHNGRELDVVPIFAANMHHTGTIDMYNVLKRYNCCTALSKFIPQKYIFENIKKPEIKNLWFSFGLQGNIDTTINQIKNIQDNFQTEEINLCLDVANGHIKAFTEFCRRIRIEFPLAVILAGNVGSYLGAQRLFENGVSIAKIGIGSGIVCQTRDVSGVGVPQLSLIREVKERTAYFLQNNRGYYICSDGGCRSSGDVAKALIAGADFVMLGGMLAAHNECAGYDSSKEYATFYGMASEQANENHFNDSGDYKSYEGISMVIHQRGSVENTLKQILGGVRSAMSYVGCPTMEEFNQKHYQLIKVRRQHNSSVLRD